MAKGGSQPQMQYVKTEQSNLPEYARPYFESMMQRANTALTQPYTPYGQERIAGFTPEQQQVQQNILGQQLPQQFGMATQMAGLAGLGALNPMQVSAQNVQADKMQAAQTGYRPNLTTFQMAAPGQFGQSQAQQYMSPYMQSVMDVQKREAVRDTQKSQLMQDLGAARQGTYGGSRQLLAGLERERALGTQLGDIQARGQQAAFESAQAQYERDRAAQMQAQQANLQAQLGVQGLQTSTDMQVALANLSNEQQARVQNMAAENQMRGMNAENALRAALANQQNQMQGLQLSGQMAQTMGNIGQMQGQSGLALLSQQQATAAQQQALQQQKLDTAYQDFLRQRDYPMEQLQQYSSLLRGVPVTPSTTQTGYAPAPSLASQLVGTGLSAASMYNMLK